MPITPSAAGVRRVPTRSIEHTAGSEGRITAGLASTAFEVRSTIAAYADRDSVVDMTTLLMLTTLGLLATMFFALYYAQDAVLRRKITGTPVQAIAAARADATAVEAAFLERFNEKSTGRSGFNRSLRYSEGALEFGEKITVLGVTRPGEGAVPLEIGMAGKRGVIRRCHVGRHA